MAGPNTAGRQRLPGAAGLVAALVAASCCLLPLALIGLGVAGSSLMMTMMRYEWITLPLGVFGLAGAYVSFFRERRRCDAAGCRLGGKEAPKVLLGVATAIVAVALLLRLFPSWASAILQRL